MQRLAAGDIVIKDIDDANFNRWVASFAAIKITERPVEGLHSRINSILRVTPCASLSFISNNLRFESMLDIIAYDPMALQRTNGQMHLLEKLVGFRREVLKLLNLEASQHLNAMNERELSNLLYRDSVRMKHAQLHILADMLQAGKTADADAHDGAKSRAETTACSLCQMLVSHMIDVSYIN